VEWLVEQIENKNGKEFSSYYSEFLEQAKEMEKEQIIEAHDAAYIAMNLAFRGFDRSVEYYEKTYNSK